MRLTLTQCHRSNSQLFFEYDVDGLRFTNSLWYPTCDLVGLERRFGVEPMENVYFHIAAFEMNKICSLGVDEVDFGPFDRFVTPEFVTLWQRIFHGVWAQWRYENQRPDHVPPTPIRRGEPVDIPPLQAPDGDRDYLVFCGGGKDSLLSSSLMTQLGADHDLFVYSSSIYGPAARQFEIIEGLIAHLRPGSVHTLSVFDDFLDSPVLQVRSELGVSTLTAAETPSSIFEALPLVLEHGYRYLVLGHEKSADTGNLIWDRTGEDVNHQWGKSWEAEKLLADYLRSHLVENLDFFSILKSIHDVVIFGSLQAIDPEAIATTHSCNLAKPWCKRCPKCVYVWLNYLAYLDPAQVRAIFGENLFDVTEVADITDEMLGLREHTPFECIGQIEESRLALEMCRSKGLTGPLMDRYRDYDWSPDEADTLARFAAVDHDYQGLPEALRDPLLRILDANAEKTRRYVVDTNSSPL